MSDGAAGRPWLVQAVVTGGVLPAALLAAAWAQGELGANPVGTALNRLGLLGLICLTASLSCTPLGLLTGAQWPGRVRRALGLVGFGYVTAHLLLYVLVDQAASLTKLLEDVVKRPFITVGTLAWLTLVPLALTSSTEAVRRLGYERWKRLHRLAYVAGSLGVVHFVWRAKKDRTEALTYGAVLGLGLALRVVGRWRAARQG